MIFTVPFLGLVFLFGHAIGDCDTCQSNYVTCHSETTFSLCIAGIPDDSIVSCPLGKVCTDQTAICVAKENGINPSCILDSEIIEEDDTPISFEIDPTTDSVISTEAAASGTDQSVTVSEEPENSESTKSEITDTPLPEETSARESSSQETSTSESSTADPSTTETTPRAPRDVKTFCTETATVGTFKAEGDTTCTGYYICVTFRGGFKGYSFMCDNSNYFNPETGWCQKGRPDNC